MFDIKTNNKQCGWEWNAFNFSFVKQEVAEREKFQDSMNKNDNSRIFRLAD